VGEKEILAVSARETGHLRERGGQGIRFYLNKEVHTYVFAALQIEVKISMIQGVDEITSCHSWRGSPYCSQIKQAVRYHNGNLVNQLVLNPLIRLSGYQVY
jgi:hypothetical protein